MRCQPWLALPCRPAPCRSPLGLAAGWARPTPPFAACPAASQGGAARADAPAPTPTRTRRCQTARAAGAAAAGAARRRPGVARRPAAAAAAGHAARWRRPRHAAAAAWWRRCDAAPCRWQQQQQQMAVAALAQAPPRRCAGAGCALRCHRPRIRANEHAPWSRPSPARASRCSNLRLQAGARCCAVVCWQLTYALWRAFLLLDGRWRGGRWRGDRCSTFLLSIPLPSCVSSWQAPRAQLRTCRRSVRRTLTRRRVARRRCCQAPWTASWCPSRRRASGSRHACRRPCSGATANRSSGSTRRQPAC